MLIFVSSFDTKLSLHKFTLSSKPQIANTNNNCFTTKTNPVAIIIFAFFLSFFFFLRCLQLTKLRQKNLLVCLDIIYRTSPVCTSSILWTVIAVDKKKRSKKELPMVGGMRRGQRICMQVIMVHEVDLSSLVSNSITSAFFNSEKQLPS